MAVGHQRLGTLPHMERHFTVTGFVIDGDRTLLHWHKKLRIWLPPGGHIDANEDPVQAVLREVREETGIVAEIVSGGRAFSFTNVTALATPFSIIVADVAEGDDVHQHIDFSYVVRPVASTPRGEPEEDHGFVWVSEDELRRNDPLPVASCGVDVAVPEDVREVGLAAIGLARSTPNR
jgi:8-oxo-dGTP pyrophosphatase MutT (NUDIX family)